MRSPVECPVAMASYSVATWFRALLLRWRRPRGSRGPDDPEMLPRRSFPELSGSKDQQCGDVSRSAFDSSLVRRAVPPCWSFSPGEVVVSAGRLLVPSWPNTKHALYILHNIQHLLLYKRDLFFNTNLFLKLTKIKKCKIKLSRGLP